MTYADGDMGSHAWLNIIPTSLQLLDDLCLIPFITNSFDNYKTYIKAIIAAFIL